MVIGLNGVLAGILKLVGEKLVHETDSPAFLKLVNENSGSFFRDEFQSDIQLFATIAALGSKNIACQALGMNADERGGLRFRATHDERKDVVRFVIGLEPHHFERTERRGKACRR